MTPTAPAQSRFNLPRNLRLLYVFGFAREFTPLLAIWVVYLTDFRDLTLGQVAVMEGLFWGVKLALEVPSGAIADRFGRRATFIFGMGFEVIGTLLFALAGDFQLLIVSYVLWSAGLAFRSGNDEAYLYDALTSGDRESEYSDRIAVFWSLSTVAALAGGVAGGVLAEVANLQVAVLAALTPYALGLPLLFMMQEPPVHAHARRLGLMETLRTGLRESWRSPPLRSMILLQVALTAAFPAYFLLSQPFLQQHDVPLALFGVLGIPVQLARMGGGLVSGRATRRFGLTTTLWASVFATSAGLVMMALVDHVVAFAGMAVTFAGVAFALPAIGGYINDRTETAVRATVLSVGHMGTSLTMGIAALASGLIAENSLQLGFAALAIVVAVSSAACIAAWQAADGPRIAPESAIVEV